MRQLPFASRTALGLLAACAVTTPLSAQNFDRIAPKPVPTTPAPTAGTPALPDATAAQHGGAIVVPSLHGLVFVPGREAVKPNGVSGDGISAAGLDPLADPAFRTTAGAYLGKPLSFDGLHAITQAVVAAYAAQGRPLVRAIVPQQNVDSGTIQIVVMEYRVGTLSVEGNRWFTAQQIEAPFDLHHGDIVEAQQVSDALDEVNANPFRRVELVYRPSAEVGYTDLVLETRDRFPFRPYAGYENSGPKVTGRDRWIIGFNWGKAFGADQQLSYQFTTSSNFWTGHKNDNGTDRANFVGHSLIWSTRLAWGDHITAFGVYERSVPNIGADFGLVGKAGQASIRYDHAFSRIGAIKQDLQIGFDFKSTNNNLDFGGQRVSHAQTEIDQFLATYTAVRPDAWGSTGLTATLTYSPGGISGANHDADFQPTLTKAGRLGAKANYLYFRAELDRQTALPLNATWSLRLIGQVSNRPLLETEQLSVGGVDLLRGYEPNAINGDQGIVIANELRTPDLIGKGDAHLRLVAFLDYASLSNKEPDTGQSTHVRATSAGVGLRFNRASHLTVKADYGWQLQHLPDQKKLSNLASISIVAGY
ncbi:ShlB/FhaC/HecB family hemolysin secretion/activation protein [Sphingomonas sp. MMS24-J13]|uniref:ShlB/FhaC/HecB family hemolysin secretion/activation protein n=1 Tax=Sphingomonas sp. MMS24-J13 TaxID=3238686 RepID=UPI00384A9E86